MDWQNVLKRRIESLADYTNASPKERQKYHQNKSTFYTKRLTALRNSIAHVGETNPNIPLEEDMRELQELRNFHARQADRIRRNAIMSDYFSPELEEERMKVRLQKTPRGVPNPVTELTLEEYEKLTREQKIKYHNNMRRRRDFKFHQRQANRLYHNSPHPTVPTPNLGGESKEGITETKEEYDNMTTENKMKFHKKMSTRFSRQGDNARYNFHSKMYGRLRRNSPLPTFYSPEHEEEE
jgi:hypothetical protein